METTHRLNRFSYKLGVVKPKKEVQTQIHESGNISPFVNGGPMHVELVAIAVGQDFNVFRLRHDQRLVTAKTRLSTEIAILCPKIGTRREGLP